MKHLDLFFILALNITHHLQSMETSGPLVLAEPWKSMNKKERQLQRQQRWLQAHKLSSSPDIKRLQRANILLAQLKQMILPTEKTWHLYNEKHKQVQKKIEKLTNPPSPKGKEKQEDEQQDFFYSSDQEDEQCGGEFEEIVPQGPGGPADDQPEQSPQMPDQQPIEKPYGWAWATLKALHIV